MNANSRGTVRLIGAVSIKHRMPAFVGSFLPTNIGLRLHSSLFCQ